MKNYLVTILLLFSLVKNLHGFQTNQSLDSSFVKIQQLYSDKEYGEALRKALNLLKLSQNDGNTDLSQKCYYLISDIYYQIKSYKKALLYWKKGLELLKSSSIKNDLDSDFKTSEQKINYYEYLLKIGSSYHKISVTDTLFSEKYKDSAVLYYSKVLETRIEGTENLKAKAYSNLAVFEIRNKDYIKGRRYINEAIKLYRLQGKSVDEAAALSNLGSVYLLEKDYLNAKRVYSEALSLVKKDTSANGIAYKGSLYANLAWSMRILKEFEAYDYLEISYNLKNEISNNRTKRDLERIQGEYNVNLVRKEEELKRQRANRNTWILGISLTLVIITLGFILNQNKLKQKNLQLALSKKETESPMEVLNANLKGQEEERKRISQELHDGVLSRLFGSRMGLGYLELDGDKETQEQYEKFLDELQNIEKEIRGVSHQLSSDITISETSFINAVNQLLKEKSKLGNFDFQLKMDDGFSWKELDGVLEMNLFRILQESLQNILKHAQAQKVFVSFKVEKQQIVLEITDDGVGFDTSTKSKGIGLKNIDARVHKLKGNFDLQTEKGQGTALTISLPIT